MACDRAFGNIERKITSLGVIYTPDDYIRAIESATSTGFNVIKMKQGNFLNFGSLITHVTKRKAVGSSFKDSRKILLRNDYLEGYLLKSDYEADDSNITRVRLQKGRARVAWSRQLFDLSAHPLTKQYNGPISLTPEKVRDLQYLLTLLPTMSHPFYQEIIDANTAGRTDGSSNEDESDDLLFM